MFIGMRGTDKRVHTELEKAKLYAYLMCKQGDKAKARAAIDAYIAVAQECLATIMEGGCSTCIVNYALDPIYVGCKDDENARRMGETMKEAIDFMEFCHDTM